MDGQWLNRVLTAGGRPDLVYGFPMNTDYPSWGWSGVICRNGPSGALHK